MGKKLFCEICPLTYKVSVCKLQITRYIKNIISKKNFAKTKSGDKLPVLIFSHSSIIRRNLCGVDMTLQENKATNLSIAVNKVDGIIINPGEVFSFWHLVGKLTKRKGYKPGLNISGSTLGEGIGGGMCQFTNLIHWMILNTSFEIVEHHHHEGFDLFPDSGRVIPFGTGTSIAYNYLDYRFRNNSDSPIQINVWVDDTCLCGEIRGYKDIPYRYEIKSFNEHFERKGDNVYRVGSVIRKTYTKSDNSLINEEKIRDNYAKVMYDTEGLKIQ